MNMRTTFLAFTCFFSVAALEAAPEVSFLAGSTKIQSEAFSTGQKGVLATIAAIGVDPTKAAVNGVTAKLLLHDHVSRLTLLQFEGEADHHLGEGGGSPTIGDHFLYSKEDKARYLGEITHFGGRILPLTMYRVQYAEGKVPLAGTLLKNEKGEVVAIAHQPFKDSGPIAFALPVQVMSKISQDYASHQSMQRSWVGINMDLENVSPVVLGVRPESPAKKAGLQKGDVIIKIAGQLVGNYQECVNRFYFLKPGESCELSVIRGVDVMELKLTPSLYPKAVAH